MAVSLFFRPKPQRLWHRDLPINVPDSQSTGWNINLNQVRLDLSEGKERPKWILSSFAPGRNVPASLFEDMEYSPEELRVRFYEQAAQGKESEADQEAIALWTKQEQAMKDVVNNADNIPKFMEEADKKHPNRYDFCKTDGSKTRDQLAKEAEAQNSNPSSGFGTTGSGFGTTTSTNNPFSKPPTSTFGQPQGPSAFGAPAFGQSAFGSTGSESQSSTAFGKPSLGGAVFGSSGFGQPSQPISAFGQPSQPTSAFGQPSQPSSAFGQPAFGSTGFNSSAPKNPFAAPSAGSGFGGTSSAFGANAPTTTAFGQPSQSSSPFGQASQPTSTFGQSSQPTSTFGQPSQPTSTFGQPSQSASTFGQPSQPTSAFGQSASPFGQASGTAASGFGQTSQATPAFGGPATSTGFGSGTSAFGQPSQPSAFGQSAFGKPSTPGFGQTGFGAGTAPTTSAFGQPSQPGTTSAFGQNTTTPAFGAPAFGSAPTVGGFGQNAASTSSSFAAGSATATAPNDQAMEVNDPASSKPQTENPFNRPRVQSSGGFGMNLSLPNIDESTQMNTALPANPVATTVHSTASNMPTLSVQPPSSSQAPHPLTSQPSKAMHYTQTLALNPPRFNTSKQLVSYRNCRVEYFQDATSSNPNATLPSYQRPDGRGQERIWFPLGSENADVQAVNKASKIDDFQLEDEFYTDEILNAWKRVFDTGGFEPGKVPVVPPKREWCLYDF